jgi:hypothetical protein
LQFALETVPCSVAEHEDEIGTRRVNPLRPMNLLGTLRKSAHEPQKLAEAIFERQLRAIGRPEILLELNEET